MKFKSIIFYLLISWTSFAQKHAELKSPDGNIIFSFNLTEEAPVYEVVYKGKTLIEDSELGFEFKEGGIFGTNLKMGKLNFKKVDENYELVVGKTKKVRDQHREVIIPLVERNRAKRQINLVVRAFNDGVAFRYEFPKQDNWPSYTMTAENSSFKISGNPTVYTLFWDNYTNNHEGLYNVMSYDEVISDTLMYMPTLFIFPNETYMAITEANLRNYAGMYLVKDNSVLRSQLSPLPGQTEEKVKATLPHNTPWRVIMIGDRAGALLESNILTNLNEPNKIKDISWIKPGKTTFHWWNGDIVPDTTFAPGINFETNKYYIDFAARNNIDYHAVIGYGGFAWYKSDASGYSNVGPVTDVTQTVPSLNIKKVIDYAKNKGVGIHVWVHWQAIYPDLNKAFSQFEEWGIKGMMVDFMNRDDQEMVNIQEEILQKAAEHKLYIQFHGSFKPTGLHRTYPNEFTREGTHNYEQNKWSEEGVSPEHDLNIVFTRALAGAADYHLGGFRAVPKTEFQTQYTRPLMIGTRCHMLAMYVVLENYLASICDYPEAYEGEMGFDFITEVPTNWDETIVPEAKLESHVVIARRKGVEWYIGSINNSEKKQISFSLDFLEDRTNYEATIYRDGEETKKDPNKITIEKRILKKEDNYNFNMESGGGMVMKLKPLNN